MNRTLFLLDFVQFWAARPPSHARDRLHRGSRALDLSALKGKVGKIESATLILVRAPTSAIPGRTFSVFEVSAGNAKWKEGSGVGDQSRTEPGDCCWNFRVLSTLADSTKPGTGEPWLGTFGLSGDVAAGKEIEIPLPPELVMRWIWGRFGEAAWRDWLSEMGRDYFRPVNEAWKSGGLPAVAGYWRDFFHAESGSEVEVREDLDRVVIEMTDCPSRGFLLRNGLEFSGDYCNHCIGWIGPMMRSAGHGVRHAHNHQGQCVWEFFPESQPHLPAREVAARHSEVARAWEEDGMHVDRFAEPDVGGNACPEQRP